MLCSTIVFAQGANTNFENCDQAIAAGFSNIKKGSPQYSEQLDRDKDGIACDQVSTGSTSKPSGANAQTANLLGQPTAAKTDSACVEPTTEGEKEKPESDAEKESCSPKETSTDHLLSQEPNNMSYVGVKTKETLYVRDSKSYSVTSQMKKDKIEPLTEEELRTLSESEERPEGIEGSEFDSIFNEFPNREEQPEELRDREESQRMSPEERIIEREAERASLRNRP